MGNLGMILLITASPPLHTPMYFFLRILSFIDACCSSVIAPKLVVDLVSDEKTISYNGCAAQLYFFCCLVDTESFLLTVMAYDMHSHLQPPALHGYYVQEDLLPACNWSVSGKHHELNRPHH